MVYPLSGANPALTSDLPWYWRTPISCPRCAFTFLLTAEETMPGLVTNLGATGSLALGWKQLVEGDPATAAYDTSNQHLDPAQVVGPCPQCGYNPIVVRGPHYGTTKTTLNTNPVTSPIQDYIALGAYGVGFWLTNDERQIGVYLLASGLPYQADSSGMNVLGALRIDSLTVNPSYTYPLITAGRRMRRSPYALIDPTFIAYLTGVGLVPM